MLDPFFQQMMAQMQATFSGGQGGDSAIGMETLGFLMELPLRDIFYFQENALPMPPEDLVEGLLAQANQNNQV